MSTSLLLALLEAQGDEKSAPYGESDRSKDYYAWIGAEWNGREWTQGIPERQELMLRALYDVLQAATNMTLPGASGPLGTVLARTLTDEPRGLPEAARQLRAVLRPALLERLDELMARYDPIKP